MANKNLMFAYLIILLIGFLALVVTFYHSATSVLIAVVVAYLILGVGLGIYISQNERLANVDRRLRPLVIVFVFLCIVVTIVNGVLVLFNTTAMPAQKLAAAVSLGCLMIVCAGVLYYRTTTIAAHRRF